MGWEGCRRRNDCATEVVTQRNVSLVWPGREHRRDPNHSSAWGVSGASRSRRNSAPHSVTVPYGMFQCRDAPRHFLAVYSHLQAFTEMSGAESGAMRAAVCDRLTWTPLPLGLSRGHPQPWGCVLQPLQKLLQPSPEGSQGVHRWHKETQKLQA